MSVLCLVPTALRAQRAARRLCDAQAGVLLDSRVTTLEGLVPGLLAASGVREPSLSPLAERLLVLDIGQEQGGVLAGVTQGHGLARELVSSIGELRRGEVEPQVARAAAAGLSGGPRERLSALAAVLSRYEERLLERGVLDRAGAMRRAADALARGASSEETLDLDYLVLEGFVALPPAALDLVRALAGRSRRTQVRMPYFPERADLSFPAEGLVRRLEGFHGLPRGREVEIVFEDLCTARKPRLARVLATVAGGVAGEGEGGDGLLVAELGAGEEGTFERAAQLSARLLEAGFAPHEIAILSASPERASAAVGRACRELGIPFAPGRGAPLASQPPVRAVLDALNGAVHPSRAALERVVDSPYLGFHSLPDLGRWLDGAGAFEGRGDPEEALRRRASSLSAGRRKGERAGLLGAAALLADLGRALRPFAMAARPREHAARLRSLVASAGVRRRAARGELEVARRDLAALRRLEEVSDELARALGLLGRGEESLAAGAWARLLETAIGEAALPSAANEPAAGAVELWPLGEAPGLSARACIVLGCERGHLPAPLPPEVLLREAERAALARAAGRAVVATAPMRRAEAMHVAFCALAAGREAVALLWRGKGPEGAGAAPAPLVEEALFAAGVELPGEVARAPSLYESRCPGEALAAFARSARGRSSAQDGFPTESILAARTASVLARAMVEDERSRAVLAHRASPAAGGLPADLLGELGRVLPAEWSPSELEEHARCPYRLFSAVVLRLKEPEADGLDPDPRDEGQLAHLVLERFMRARMVRGALPLKDEPEEHAELTAVVAEVCAAFEAEGRTGDSAVWAGRREALLSRLRRVLATEAQASEGTLPVLLEYRFGGDSGIPPLAFADAESPGGEIRLRGRIDRVDAGSERLVLIDYKSGKRRDRLCGKLRDDALGVTSFQVPVYLLVAARDLPGHSRLEATYLLLGTGERLPPFVAHPEHPLLARDSHPQEAVRAASLFQISEGIVAAVRRIRSGEMPIVSRDCGGCAYGALCRFETQAEARS